MNHTTGTLVTADGLKLFFQRWRPRGRTRAAVAIVHGIGEHSDNYGAYVEHLVERGYAVYGIDQRGYGRSPGRRGHVNGWHEYREDLRAYVRTVAAAEPDVPRFILGHSLGGLITLDYLLHGAEGLRGAVLSAPALESAGATTPFLEALSRVLSRVWPSFSVALPEQWETLSRDPAYLSHASSDPLRHGKASVRLGTEAAAAMAWVRARPGDLRLPFLLIYGDADRLVPPQNAQRFYEQAASEDKTVLVYPGGAHELHNDVCRAQVAADVERWLAARLAPEGAR